MAETYKVELGRAIARRRLELGLTQKDLADATHYKEAQTVSRWERGQNLPGDLEIVARALKWSLSDLVAGINPPDGKAARYLGLAPPLETPDAMGALPPKSTHERLTAIEDQLRRLSEAIGELIVAEGEPDQATGRQRKSRGA